MSERPAGPEIRTVTLDTPLKRGETELTTIGVRRPKSGELRGGISLVSLAQLDVDELRKILPRITIPPLAAAEVDQLEISDLLSLGAEVSDFLLPSSLKPAVPAT